MINSYSGKNGLINFDRTKLRIRESIITERLKTDFFHVAYYKIVVGYFLTLRDAIAFVCGVEEE
jgi:hypothetical protein